MSEAGLEGRGYRYVAVYRCAKCKIRLSDRELMYSSGVCPHCGHATRGTVCDYEKSAEQIDEPQHEPPAAKPGTHNRHTAVVITVLCLFAAALVIAVVSESIMEGQAAAHCQGSCASRSVKAVHRTRGPVVCVCGDGTVELSKP